MRSYHNYCLIKKNRRPRVLKNSIGAIAKPGHTLFQQGGRELLVPKGTWQRHSFIAQDFSSIPTHSIRIKKESSQKVVHSKLGIKHTNRQVGIGQKSLGLILKGCCYVITPKKVKIGTQIQVSGIKNIYYNYTEIDSMVTSFHYQLDTTQSYLKISDGLSAVGIPIEDIPADRGFSCLLRGVFGQLPYPWYLGSLGSTLEYHVAYSWEAMLSLCSSNPLAFSWRTLEQAFILNNSQYKLDPREAFTKSLREWVLPIKSSVPGIAIDLPCHSEKNVGSSEEKEQGLFVFPLFWVMKLTLTLAR